MEHVVAAAQLLYLIGLGYGAAVVFMNWREIVPTGAESDAQFMHHPRDHRRDYGPQR